MIIQHFGKQDNLGQKVKPLHKRNEIDKTKQGEVHQPVQEEIRSRGGRGIGWAQSTWNEQWYGNHHHCIDTRESHVEAYPRHPFLNIEKKITADGQILFLCSKNVDL